MYVATEKKKNVTMYLFFEVLTYIYYVPRLSRFVFNIELKNYLT